MRATVVNPRAHRRCPACTVSGVCAT